MDIIKASVYVGPNIYSHARVIRLTMDMAEFADESGVSLGKDFTGQLLYRLPGLMDHKNQMPAGKVAATSGWAQRLEEDPDCNLAEILAHMALELQRIAGISVNVALAAANPDPDIQEVVFEYESEVVGLDAGDLAFDMLAYMVLEAKGRKSRRGLDMEDELTRFIQFAQRRAFGPSTRSLIKAAEARNIPWMQLNNDSLIQLGHGKKQQRIEATTTGRTSLIAAELASDKQLTNEMLLDLGLPVPDQRLVRRRNDAVKAAERIGFPIVVKPLDANHGRGVSIDLRNGEDVAAAFDKAIKHSPEVLVETSLPGHDHRILMVDGKMVAAAKRVPGHVVGDGQKTIAELIEDVNADSRRGVGHEKVLTRIEMDDQARRMLERAHMTFESVPEDGVIVWLRDTANLSTGGTAIDVTDQIHPDNREMAERTMRAVGLDIGGVDFITTDISKSWRKTGGAICEINAAPGFRMHISPSEGSSRDVAGAVMDMLFPEGETGDIPIAAVTGTNGKTTTCRMLSHIQTMAGLQVGLTSSDAVYIDGQLSVKGDLTGPAAARMVLRDPAVDCAVLETARGGLLRKGLGFETCDVAAVLNVTPDHLGMGGVDTIDDLAAAKRLVVETATHTAVLNADDPLTLAMADHCRAENICYVTRNPDHKLVHAHIQQGCPAVVLEPGMNGDMISIYHNGTHTPLIWTHLIPATMEGRAMHNVENAMFAAALAWSMGTRFEHIRRGLRTFDSTFYQAPGRMNVFDEHPFKVILDYGHNAAGINAMASLVQKIGAHGRQLVVAAAPNDRREDEIDGIAEALWKGGWDHYILRQDDDLRGNAFGTNPAKLKQGLLARGVEDDRITIIEDEQAAIQGALDMAQKDDLLLIFGDNLTRCWKQIIYFDSGEEQPAKANQANDAATPDRQQEDLASSNLIIDERGVRLAIDPVMKRH